jgi:hypothetical protein
MIETEKDIVRLLRRNFERVGGQHVRSTARRWQKSKQRLK